MATQRQPAEGAGPRAAACARPRPHLEGPAVSGAFPYKVAFVIGVGFLASSVASGASYLLTIRHRLPFLPPEPLANFRELLHRGELRRAAREHRLASLIDPTSYGNLPELAEAMRRAGDAEGEIDQYRQALERWPLDPATHRALGQAYCRYRRFDEGIACLKEALRLDPRDARTHLALGEAWLEQERFADAARSFADAVRLEPHAAVAHNGLGIALALSGRPRQAVDAFAAALRLSPSPEYRANLERAREAAERDQAGAGAREASR